MRFLLIIPAHNEEQNILFTLKSLENQIFKDYLCLVVNDGSTDKTRKIVEEFITDAGDLKFKILNLKLSNHEPGAKVVRTFNKGLETVDINDFDVICKFDADIIFPENYLEEMAKLFQNDLKCGLAGGLLYIEKNEQWIYEGNSNKEHVRGPVKAYRKECFLEIGGLRETLGWDNIDSILLKNLGWKEIVLPELHVKLLKYKGKDYTVKQSEYYGKYFYFLGLYRALTYIAALKEAGKNKSILFFVQIIKSYENCRRKNLELKITKTEQKIINKYRWNIFKKKWFKL